MTNQEWLKSLDTESLAQFLGHTLFVRNMKTGDKSDIGIKTLINSGEKIEEWLKNQQEFAVAEKEPELLPCPFCGETNGLGIAEHLQTGKTFFFVMCENCDTYGGSADSKKRAAEKWNTRAKMKGE